jgi:hypothetical protein
MARKYEVPVCTGCGGQFGADPTCTCPISNAKTGKIVGAIDARDVEPLVAAARALNEATTVEGIVRAVNGVRKSFKAFEDEEGSGG